MKFPNLSRRLFLEAGGAAAASLALSQVALAQPTPSAGGVRAEGQPMGRNVQLPASPPQKRTDDSVGYAIVGLGGYALNQMMPRFAKSERSHIAAIVSGNPEKLKKVGDAYGVPQDARYSYDNFDAIINDKRVEAVYIVLPSGLHAEWTEKAFAAGKHVLCEKPMALSSAECERMIAASQRANRKLMIAYRCHFEPHNLLAMQLMREKAVGPLRLIRTDTSYRMWDTTPAQNWRLRKAMGGSSPMEDLGIYALQSALYLSHEMPKLITASALQPANDPRFTEIFAHVAAQMRFPSGTVAQISTSYDAAGGNLAFVQGQTGTLNMNPATPYGGHKMRLETSGQPGQDLTPGDSEAQFWGQLDHLTNAIRDNAAIIPSGEMGLRDIRLIEAIYASATTGTAIRLNPDATMRT